MRAHDYNTPVILTALYSEQVLQKMNQHLLISLFRWNVIAPWYTLFKTCHLQKEPLST